ncbi:uncharacterized protein LOC126897928 [Daktulosphaira vitifoliae]|uniref:uncharacterized protein LOC126897928 n=1 Tax=Daktulosphaira vitifoliae TaxID=58002 RepID=UPI0021AAE932|nr:uncharacterized protein LOC126897928 [Daktulosphaira vitifoliae]
MHKIIFNKINMDVENENVELLKYSDVNDFPTTILNQLSNIVKIIKYGTNTQQLMQMVNSRLNDSEFDKICKDILKKRNQIMQMQQQSNIESSLAESVDAIKSDLQTSIENEKLQPTDIKNICNQAVNLRLSYIKNSNKLTLVEEFIKQTEVKLQDISKIEDDLDQVHNNSCSKNNLLKQCSVKIAKSKYAASLKSVDHESSSNAVKRVERDRNNFPTVKTRLERIREIPTNNSQSKVDAPALKLYTRTANNNFSRSNIDMNSRLRSNEDHFYRESMFSADDYLFEFSSSNNSTLNQDKDFDDTNSGDIYLSLVPFNNETIDNNNNND